MTGPGVTRRLEQSPVLDFRVLEAIADGQPLRAVLTMIANGLEDLVRGWHVSVMLVSADGTTLQNGASPSLPEGYVSLLKDIPVGPGQGSCGTAVHRRSTVIVEDIATDPLWATVREYALSFGLRACWSMPVVDADGTVLATFAVYHRAPARPESAHLQLIRRFMHLARVAIHHDRAQRKMRESEERFRTFFRDAAFGLVIADLTGRFVHTNTAYRRMLGYTEEELQSRNLLDITHQDDLELNRVLVSDLRNGRRDSFVMEKRYLARDGHLVWARVTVSPRHDEHGRVIETIAIAEDITRERAAEQQRRLQQSLLEVASRVGRLGAWSYSFDSRELYLSDELQAILGLSADQSRTRESLFDAFAPEYQPSVQAAVRACSTEGTPFDMEARLTTAQGTGRWVRVIGEAVRDEDGAIVAARGALQDITDRKRLEQQSLRSQRLESIGTLAGGIAHDLNNVLTPIAMGVGLLKAGDDDQHRLQLLDIIEASAARAARMVQQVLSFARGAEAHRTRVSPAHLVAEMTALLRDTMPKQIRLDIDSGQDVWPVDVDPTQIHQVLLNLCVNSRDAMPWGGTLRIVVRNVVLDDDTAHASGVVGAGDYVRVTVEDTGEGIAADVIDKIFDPFFTTKPIGRGTGLGLSTSLGIVQRHGGHIDVTSTQGLGSRFDVLLPAARRPTQPLLSSAHEQRPPAGRGTVLLVDDEASVRLVAREVLERSGYQVLEAASGEQALAIYRAQQPTITVVVTDIMMPGMDGADLVRAIRTLSGSVPIIGMSGVTGSERQALAESWGLNGFLQKPYALDALKGIVYRAVSGDRI